MMTMMTMMTKTRTTRTKLCVLFSFLAFLTAVQAQKDGKSEPYAIVRGSVFQESGRAQPGAKVVLSPRDQPGKKLQEQTSSPRGEFSFRVPPGPAFYVLTATMKGFETASKEVELVAQEQINKTLLLVPASK